ncbi:ArsR family transcriptional regulator [Peribacillus butanolivorans]|uniref:ArsR family transcriptional regulator n=1 Tax=Peribacillus butanolivorans TaxID=421767 RepID=UPI0035E3AB7A
MGITIGLIGVKDTIDFISSVITEHEDVACITLVHENPTDIERLMKEYENKVDMWLFSGYLPYMIGLVNSNTAQSSFYLTYSGTSLYKTLYLIQSEHGVTVNQLSFDTINPLELESIFRELNVDYSKHLLQEEVLDVETVVKHHEDLYRSGLTQFALTCVWSVQQELEKRNIPVYRITPTISDIKATVNIMLRHNELEKYRNAQIAVQMIEIDILEVKDNYITSSDELYHLEVKYTSQLLRYSKKINGSLKQVGPGRYVIFTTQGMLKWLTTDFKSLPSSEFEELFKLNKIIVGIGMGQSAYEAEMHALRALYKAREHGEGAWFVCFHDKKLFGPLNSLDGRNYVTETEELKKISSETSLSVVTLAKLSAAIDKLKKSDFSANTVAQELSILPRSARRILMTLEKNGYANVVSEEHPYTRGRPRKIYRLLLKNE